MAWLLGGGLLALPSLKMLQAKNWQSSLACMHATPFRFSLLHLTRVDGSCHLVDKSRMPFDEKTRM